jgi:hypothetical protein
MPKNKGKQIGSVRDALRQVWEMHRKNPLNLTGLLPGPDFFLGPENPPEDLRPPAPTVEIGGHTYLRKDLEDQGYVFTPEQVKANMHPEDKAKFEEGLRRFRKDKGIAVQIDPHRGPHPISKTDPRFYTSEGKPIFQKKPAADVSFAEAVEGRISRDR